MTNLQLTHLRFDCIATTPIKMGGHYAGNNLRNALANVMRRSTCPESNRKGDPSPAHVATCPACWLLTSNIDPGTVVRAYAVIPPMPPKYDLAAGEHFSFGLTLFGNGFRHLPYFVLAITEMGQAEGIGPSRRTGNGRFTVQTISAVDPLRGDIETLFTPNDNLVEVPTHHVDWTAVSRRTQHHLQHLNNQELMVRFFTPMRLEEKQRPFKSPDFSVFFRRTLYRIDELNRQFAGAERRNKEEVMALYAFADQVRLLDAQTDWHELWTNSSRKGHKTPIGGFTGTAVYRSEQWEKLLPWLILGQATQSGKSVIKGNGVFALINENWPCYWDWMLSDLKQ